MAIWWIDPTNGLASNAGSYDFPKQYSNDVTPAAGDEIRWKATAASWILVADTLTVSKNSLNATMSSSGHGLLANDLFRYFDGTDYHYVQIASVSGASITLNNEWHLENVTNVPIYFTRPHVYNGTLTNSTLKSNGTALAPIVTSWGWDSPTTMNGVSAYKMAGVRTVSLHYMTSTCDFHFFKGEIFVIDANYVLERQYSYSSMYSVGKIYAFGCNAAINMGSVYSCDVEKIYFVAKHSFNGVYYFPVTGTIATINELTCILTTGARQSVDASYTRAEYVIKLLKLYTNLSAPFIFDNGISNSSSIIIENFAIASQFGTGAAWRTRSLAHIDIKSGALLGLSAPMSITGFTIGFLGSIAYSRTSVSPDYKSIIGVGSVYKLSASDSNFTLLGGAPCSVVNFNVGTYATLAKRKVGVVSGSRVIMINTPQKAFLTEGTYRFRVKYNNQIPALTGMNVWLEAVDYSDSLLAESGTDALPVRSGVSDWSNTLTTGDVLFTSDQTVELRLHCNIYSAANQFAYGYAEYSIDGGISWISFNGSWVKGLPTWSLIQRVRSQNSGRLFGTRNITQF